MSFGCSSPRPGCFGRCCENPPACWPGGGCCCPCSLCRGACAWVPGARITWLSCCSCPPHSWLLTWFLFWWHGQIRARGTFGGAEAHADPAAQIPALCLALNAKVLVKRK